MAARTRTVASSIVAVVICALPICLARGAAPFPNPDWPVARDLAAVETSADRLERFGAWLEARGGDSWSAVVVKRGRLVFEGRGARSHVRRKNDCGSILKPLQATVLGAALAQGRLSSLDENALRYWKEPWPTPFENDRQITFRQFASYHDRWNEPEPPGAYRYNNAGATAAGACIAGLFGAVRGARPRGIAEVVRREIMQKIGADWDVWYWEQDFVPGNPGNPGPRMVLEASVYELAKLGYLWLRRGEWNGRRLFSESFYREAVSDWSPSTGSERFGFVGHYGYWWFVNSGRFWLPDAPEDAFYAIGNGHPKRATCLLVVPSLDTVAVLGMERLSDDGKWDVIRNSRVPSNEGPRELAAEVVRLHVARGSN